MRKITLACLVILVILFFGQFLSKTNQKPEEQQRKDNTFLSSIPKTTTTPEVNNLIEIKEAGGSVQIAWVVAATSSAVKLYPNFKDNLAASSAKEKYQCQKLLSAGFYDKNSNPLGLFVQDGKILSPDRPNAFFNGYFSLHNNGNFTIERNAPNQDVKLALQSGPVLWTNETPLELRIIDDKPARRIVVGTTKNNGLIFLALFNKDNNFDGPLLGQTPNLLTEFVQKTGIVLNGALNLDGGSASAFYSDDINLSELSPVGGFFCIL